ncbi:processed acidic surface protein [Neobacillus sp. NPDC093127]|uniref:processed acidic surface protein n=1 Tax=Neobacillus sp. NPDC093127 TaxID=3364296 RepID=UPI003811EF27
MNYQKSIFACILTLLLMANVPVANAAPPQNELNQYLTKIGWTKQQLVEYLDYYEIPLDSFDTVAELEDFLGTPINPTNLQELLTKYNLSQKELNDLLDQFGDSLADYKFIEDLDNSLAFYTNHDENFGDISGQLAQFGITEEELQKFFNYLAQVEENKKDQLDQMQSLDYRIEQFLETSDPTELTDEQIQELADIFNDILNVYEIQVKFKLNNKEITFKDLLTLKEPPGNLYTSITSKSGEPLLDFTIPAEFFQGIMDGWEELIHIGELANEFVDFLHDEKYDELQRYK